MSFPGRSDSQVLAGWTCFVDDVGGVVGRDLGQRHLEVVFLSNNNIVERYETIEQSAALERKNNRKLKTQCRKVTQCETKGAKQVIEKNMSRTLHVVLLADIWHDAAKVRSCNGHVGATSFSSLVLVICLGLDI